MFTYLWAKVSGPGDVTFVDATSLTTDASFSLPGVYVLSLTVTGGLTVGIDYVVIYVLNMCDVPGTNPTITEQNP